MNIKKILLIILFPFLILSPFIALKARPTLASSISDKYKILTIEKDEFYDKNAYLTAEIVEIYGTVEKDAFIAGGQVSIDGQVMRDLLIAGGYVNISGEIGEDVRIMAGQVHITGKIGGNLTVLGGSVEIADSAEIEGAIQAATGTLNLSAPIRQEAMILTGNLTVNNQVGKDLVVRGGTIRLTPNAEIKGDFEYWSSEEVSVSDKASVSGQTKRHETHKMSITDSNIRPFLKILGLYSKLTSLILTLTIGLIFIKLAPNHTKNAVTEVRKKTLNSLGVGILAMILLPLFVFVLFITAVGIPAGLAAIPIFISYVFVSRIFVISAIGYQASEAFSKKTTNLKAFLLGMLIYYAVSAIPIIGGIIKCFVILISTGALIKTDINLYKNAKKISLI